MKIVHVEQMRDIEAEIDSSGISYATLMERAGKAIADYALDIVADISQPRIMILVGKGNNGGDGLVAAKFMQEVRNDLIIQIYGLVARNDALTQALEGTTVVIANAEEDQDKRVLKHMSASADLIIDALFGIGIRLPLSQDVQRLLYTIQQAIEARKQMRPDDTLIDPSQSRQIPIAPPIHVLAVDCPSGVDCNTGNVDKQTLHADTTITFIAIKEGLIKYPAAKHAGRLLVANCGINDHHPALKDIPQTLVDARYVREHLPERSRSGHKGSFGRAMLVCGSTQYVGAAAFAMQGAYRSGAGLVTVATPRPVSQALAGQHPEPTWLPMPHDMGILSKEAVPLLREKMGNYHALLLGSGMVNEKATQEFVKTILAKKDVARKSQRNLGFQVQPQEAIQDDANDNDLPPLIIDADGLNILAEQDNWWELLPTNTIITPHVGEMARLAKTTVDDVKVNRWTLALEKAQVWQVVVVLKGAHTLIATPTGERWVLPFKTDALATAGTGDVLAGLITGFRAQGLTADKATIVGAYVHGLAGTLASQTQSTRSVIASDVVGAIGIALQQIEQS
jgi:hydroxyethylthiazole kinase-like uncharacterized protein yjeF